MKFTVDSNINNPVCIQKSGEDIWDRDFCEEAKENDDFNQYEIECKCHNLHPTSVVNDLEKLF